MKSSTEYTSSPGESIDFTQAMSGKLNLKINESKVYELMEKSPGRKSSLRSGEGIVCSGRTSSSGCLSGTLANESAEMGKGILDCIS